MFAALEHVTIIQACLETSTVTYLFKTLQLYGNQMLNTVITHP
jgi:hypothetical protein